MPRLYQTKIWQLQLPDGWAIRDNREQVLVCLYKPDGVGMLTGHTFEETATAVDAAGEDFRGRLPSKASTSNDNKTFRRSWRLSCRGKRLYIRYSCAAKNAGLEDDELDKIVQSIEERTDKS